MPGKSLCLKVVWYTRFVWSIWTTLLGERGSEDVRRRNGVVAANELDDNRVVEHEGAVRGDVRALDRELELSGARVQVAGVAAAGHRLVGESHIVLDVETLAPVTDVSRDVTRLRVDGVAADAAPEMLVNAVASVVPSVLPGAPPVGVNDPVPVTATPAACGSEGLNAREIGSPDTVPPALLTLALIEARPDATGPSGSNAVTSTPITPRISSPLGFVTDTTGGVVSVAVSCPKTQEEVGSVADADSIAISLGGQLDVVVAVFRGAQVRIADGDG